MTSIIVTFVVFLAAIQISTSAAAATASDVTADRAWHLAAMYYSHYVSGCGGVGDIVARGDYWEAPVYFGYAGTRQGSIRVHRHSGTVSYGGHPTVSAQSLDSWFASATRRAHAP